MTQNSKRKRKRRLPKNLTEKTDVEIVEKIFGKRVKRELDKLIEQPESADKNTDATTMK